MGDFQIEFGGNQIPVSLITNSRNYQTPKYRSVLRIIEEKSTPRLTWREALDWFFEEEYISYEEKLSIARIQVCEDSRIMCVETAESRNMFDNLEYIADNTGWYFYLTGLTLGESMISKSVDMIEKAFNSENITRTWGITSGDKISIHSISEKPNQTCHLIKIGTLNILLDAGIVSEDDWEYLKSQNIEKIDAIFLSHSHFDHYRGLVEILDLYPQTPVLCSATTLDFFVFKNSEKSWEKEQADQSIHFSDSVKQVARNSIIVKHGDVVRFVNGSLSFYNAGHMSGALMLHVLADGYDFLYTGDFCLGDYFPIQGVNSIAASLPSSIDFLLMEAAMGDVEYDTAGQIFSTLFRKLERNAQYGNQILLAAEPDSTAIVLYLSIFAHFRNLQLKHGYRNRPLMVLGRETLEYAKIVQQRLDDLHPVVRQNIKKGFNPFSSALGRFCETGREINSLLDTSNVVFIFGPPDLSGGIIQYLMKRISSYRHNLIYLSGAIRSDAALNLVDGFDKIELGGEMIDNRAQIFNREYPDKVLNFHPDLSQMLNLIQMVRPATIGLFHKSRGELIGIADKLSKLKGVKDVYVFSETKRVCKLR